MKYISGELFSKISDVSVYSYKLLNKYPNLKKNCNKIIYIDKNNPVIKSILNTSKIFFVKTDHINFFANNLLKYIDHKFILITHNSDNKSGLNKKILNNNNLIKWFGQNMVPHPKTYGIPIGLENSQWKGWDYSVIEKYKNCEKNQLLYFNFSLKTNKKRKDIENILLKKGFKKNQKKNWEKYIEDLAHHFYCISPEGNGIDCHRTWEAIYLGSVPILLKNKSMYTYFKDLPILWVDNYDIITHDFLIKNKENYIDRNYDKSKLDYWEELFNQL